MPNSAVPLPVQLCPSDEVAIVLVPCPTATQRLVPLYAIPYPPVENIEVEPVTGVQVIASAE